MTDDDMRLPTALRERSNEARDQLRRRGDDRFAQLLAKSVKVKRDADFIQTRSNLTSAERREVEELAASKVTEYRAELKELVDSIRDRLTLNDPLGMLARVCYTNLFGAWGEYYEPEERRLESHVEFVAGLLLTQPVASEPADPPDPSDVQFVLDSTRGAFELAMLGTIAEGVVHRDRDDTEADVRVRSQLHGYAVRGSSYQRHGQDLAGELYEPFGDWMRSTLGFDIDDLIRTAQLIVAQAESGIEALFEDARAELDGLSGSDELDPDERDEVLRAMARVIELFEDKLTEAIAFTSAGLAAAPGAPPRQTIEAIMSRFATSVGSHRDQQFTWPLEDNPLLERPIVEWQGRFILPVPGMLVRECVALLEPDLRQRGDSFDRHRAKVVETVAVRHLTEALPGSDGYTNLHYRCRIEGGEIQAEVDGLVLLDDVALVAESKSSSLSRPSLRGDLRRLRSELKEIVVRAWEQGARVRAVLLGDEDVTFTDGSGSEVVVVPRGQVKRVWILNPTLHPLAHLAVQLESVREMGLFPEGAYPWSVCINDLRVIAETVRNPAEFLHYLVWRSRLHLGDQVIVVDELDLFGSYLLRSEVDQLVKDPNRMVQLSGSVDFDAYYMGLEGSGPAATQPRLFSGQLVDDFLELMSRRRPQGWLEASGVCIDLHLWELAIVEAQATEMLHGIQPQEVRAVEFEGLGLAAIGPSRRWPEAEAEVRSQLSEARRVVVLGEGHRGAPRILWAWGDP